MQHLDVTAITIIIIIIIIIKLYLTTKRFIWSNVLIHIKIH